MSRPYQRWWRAARAAAAVLVAASAAAAAPGGVAAAPGGAAAAARRSHLVGLGTFTTSVKAGAELPALYRELLAARVRANGPETVLAPAGTAKLLSLRGTVTRVTTVYTEARTTVQVAVSLVALRMPSGALAAATEAEARVAIDGAPEWGEEASMRKEALAAAVDETFEGLRKALRAIR